MPEWQQSIEDAPVGKEITIALFPDFQNRAGCRADLRAERARFPDRPRLQRGVIEGRFGVALGIGVFGVGVSALTLGAGTGLFLGALDASIASVGAGTIGTELGVSVMGGTAGNAMMWRRAGGQARDQRLPERADGLHPASPCSLSAPVPRG